MTNRVPLSSILVGSRVRRDLGDLQALAESIALVGLLHPIVIDSQHRLVAGQRRLEAVKILGWETIPVTVIDLDSIAAGELIENSCRKDFLPSEIAAIARTLRPKVQEQARQRRASKLKQGQNSPVQENCLDGDGGQTRDIVARFAGVSGRTLEKIEAIIAAAEEDPTGFRSLQDEMDAAPRSVDRCYRHLCRLKQEQAHSREGADGRTTRRTERQQTPTGKVQDDKPLPKGEVEDGKGKEDQGDEMADLTLGTLEIIKGSTRSGTPSIVALAKADAFQTVSPVDYMRKLLVCRNWDARAREALEHGIAVLLFPELEEGLQP